MSQPCFSCHTKLTFEEMVEVKAVREIRPQMSALCNKCVMVLRSRMARWNAVDPWEHLPGVAINIKHELDPHCESCGNPGGLVSIWVEGQIYDGLCQSCLIQHIRTSRGRDGVIQIVGAVLPQEAS